MTATKLHIIKRDIKDTYIYSKCEQRFPKHTRRQGFIIHERKQGFGTNNQNKKSSTRSTAFICKRIPEKPQHVNRSNGP